ncbi:MULTISPECIES: hypothetical protein [Brucella/Ochrobactrum group]|uniref:Uncharacterized protein n=1 Tax=Brucella anthropi TaxID=529 RepID=A0A6L3YZJ6_BRUAN|nr:MULTISPECIES: hypothetical protein [Brucella/Ochrobactrum group]KAB2761353.1 hypothetical protein F9L04_23790 [Brucella anthropi]
MTNDRQFDLEFDERFVEMLRQAELSGPQSFRVRDKTYEISFIGKEQTVSATDFLSKGGPLNDGD